LLLLLKWSNQPGVVENADDAFLWFKARQLVFHLALICLQFQRVNVRVDSGEKRSSVRLARS
jgi:hypothetical protein